MRHSQLKVLMRPSQSQHKNNQRRWIPEPGIRVKLKRLCQKRRKCQKPPESGALSCREQPWVTLGQTALLNPTQKLDLEEKVRKEKVWI